MPIPNAPARFQGSVAELYEQHARHLLPAPRQVSAFHSMLRDYLAAPDPVHLVRRVATLKRGVTIRTAGGYRLRASDNAPAWWLYNQLHTARFVRPADISTFMESIPTHMFGVRLPEHVNKAGWHVAHLYYAKDGNTDYQGWDRKSLAWRMVRNIHPCNYFYIPLTNWQIYGANIDVLSYFHQQYAVIYRDVWDEFLAMANVSALEHRPGAGKRPYTIPLNTL